jgi:hypothetical protein
MFFRVKQSGSRRYLQIVENHWDGKGSRQRVIATLGRLEELQASGQLDGLLRSGARFAEASAVLSAHAEGDAPVVDTRIIGPPLIFERLWTETGCRAVLEELLAGRQFGFAVERALFLTVLHRLYGAGSDRAAARWQQAYAVEGLDGLELHHLYRAMAWLGEELATEQQADATPFAPRCIKDQVEEGLFARRRDLFSALELVFFDTTSIYFEGEGGERLGQFGHSKDHRADRRQMVVGVVLDGQGQPLCCELWPGNTADVATLIPVARRLQRRFGITQVCVVADRGMISEDTVQTLEQEGWGYILGARLRQHHAVRDRVLTRAGRYQVVHPPRQRGDDPSPLKVKEVWLEDRRYVVCLNEEQARHDAHQRQLILEHLRHQLAAGDRALVGNKGYRRYLRQQGEGFCLDPARLRDEARYDGKWVLATNTHLPPADLALKYKQLWMVEAVFRTAKSLLHTRPVFHHHDATIRGHVFCSFLALVLRKALQDRLAQAGLALEGAAVLNDLERLQEVQVVHQGKHFVLRTQTHGATGKVFQAVGVALPPTVRQIVPA